MFFIGETTINLAKGWDNIKHSNRFVVGATYMTIVEQRKLYMHIRSDRIHQPIYFCSNTRAVLHNCPNLTVYQYYANWLIQIFMDKKTSVFHRWFFVE